MKNITIIFNRKMKMSDLIDADYRLLLLLNRLNFTFGFGDKNVEEVCKDNNFDADCLIFLANLQSNKSITKIYEEFYKLPIEPFLCYLKHSHSYFLEERLPNIRRKLKLVLDSTDEKLRNIVLNFFDNYSKEVADHMKYEDQIVFPYIYALINNSEDIKDYNINIFEERHNDIEEKMADLKQILLKYMSTDNVDRFLLVNVLMELYTSEEELESHTFIEENLVIPRIREIEKQAIKG